MTIAEDMAPLAPTLMAKASQTPIDRIERLVRDRYGRTVSVERLHAERDEIFKLSESGGQNFILKFTSALEEPLATDLVTQALLHIDRADPILPTPRLIASTDGQLAFRAPWGGEDAPTVRLFTYLPGRPLHTAPRSVAQSAALGTALARLGLALRTFQHPGESRRLDWDLSRAGHMIPLLDAVDDRDRRDSVTRCLARFRSDVEPQLHRLRHQVVHNDFHPHNVLVDSADADRVAGIIDFGDILRTALINDVAIAASYLVPLGEHALDHPLAFVASYHAVYPLLPVELDLLYELMTARLAMTVAITQWRARREPANHAYITKNTAIAWQGLERLAHLDRDRAAAEFRRACNVNEGDRVMTKQPLMLNAFDPATASEMTPTVQSLIERRTRVLGPAYRLFYERPVHFVRGEGVRLYDETGVAYLDVYNNVPAVGHCHPRVVEAIAKQAATLNTHTRYLHDTILTYAERLTATFPQALRNVMFTCTGSESVDLALRLVRTFTGGTGIIVTDCAYHGVTAAAAEASPSLGAGVPLGAHVRSVRAPDAYRANGRDVGEQFAADVQDAIDDLRRHGIKPAALMFDTIFSSDGVLPHPAGFIAKAVAAVRAAGGMYIADEVQPGFARTGDAMWGFLRHGVLPDLVVLGKPMGNGMPIAGVVARPDVMAEFAARARYFNTFGGNPVSCAAALAVLDVIADEKLMENAHSVGEHIQAGLRVLAERDERIGEVRGAGLFIGVDFVTDRTTREPDPHTSLALVNRLRENQVLISACGRQGHVLKIRPPLPFSRADADEFLSKLSAALAEIK